MKHNPKKVIPANVELIRILSPTDQPLRRRIDRGEYEMRRDMLDRQSERIITALTSTYIDRVDKIMHEIPRSVKSPADFLTYVAETCTDNTGKTIYSYMLTLSAVLSERKCLENAVENSIQYNELEY